MSLRSLSRVAARRQAQLMAVVLSKSDNEAATRDRPALRGLQAKALTALHFLDRPTHAFKSAPCQPLCLKARDTTKLSRGSHGLFASSGCGAFMPPKRTAPSHHRAWWEPRQLDKMLNLFLEAQVVYSGIINHRLVFLDARAKAESSL